MENKCDWCGGVREHSPIHPACAREMQRAGVSFHALGIKIKSERAVIALKEGDIPKKEYERIINRDKTKLTINEMKNKWLEPFDKFMERFEQTQNVDDILSPKPDDN